MRRYALVVAAAVFIVCASSSAAIPDRDRLVAQTDAGRIFYRMIACSSEPDVTRAACEQRRLDRRIHDVWIDTAAGMNSVSLTPDEQAQVARQTEASESYIQRAGGRFHLLATAALRVRRGEDRRRVVMDLEDHHIAEQDLTWELDHLPTVSAAERAAARDFTAETRAAIRRTEGRPFILGHLRDIVRNRASAERVSFDTAEERFWSDVARATHTNIVDPAFRLPDRKGILVKP